MTTINVTKDNEGKLRGFTEKDQRAWAKFIKVTKEMGEGEIVGFSIWFPRSPKFHKLHFAICKAIFEAQEQFNDMEDLRKWLYVGAGFAGFLPGPKGKMVAIPKSIKWEKLDDAEFAETHARVVAFLRDLYCTRFLWPQMSDADASNAMNDILDGFQA